MMHIDATARNVLYSADPIDAGAASYPTECPGPMVVKEPLDAALSGSGTLRASTPQFAGAVRGSLVIVQVPWRL